MFQKYCLPISIKPIPGNIVAAVVVSIYLLPCVVAVSHGQILISVVTGVAAVLGLVVEPATNQISRSVSRLRITATGEWILAGQGVEVQASLVSWRRTGPLVLVHLRSAESDSDRRERRCLICVLENRSNGHNLLRLKVFLNNLN